MRRAAIILVLAFLASIVLSGKLLYDRWENNRVVSVVDGDSLQLFDGRRVSLLGLDAPERDQCMGSEAREKLIQMTLGKHVRLKNIVTDDYGRILAHVIVEEPDIWLSYLYHRLFILFHRESMDQFVDPMVNRVMVRAGFARYTSVNSPYTNTIKAVQNIAKENKLGIWSEECRTTNPKNFDCLIKGNTRAGKKIYHSPECPNYDEVIVDESFSDHWFCTELDAQTHGFTKASGCP